MNAVIARRMRGEFIFAFGDLFGSEGRRRAFWFVFIGSECAFSLVH